MVAPRFDDSLPALIRMLEQQLGAEALEQGVVFRDASGRLTFFSPLAPPENAELVSEALRVALGSYAHPDRVVAFSDDPSTGKFLAHPDIRVVEVVSAGDEPVRQIRYLDRRIVGADWLRSAPEALSHSPFNQPQAARLAVASLKGGVGRSTAIAVLATDQAQKGRNVLVIDLDLEAPGIGSLLLPTDRLPKFGVVDYLVERNFTIPDREFLEEMIGVSSLTQGHGLVHVIPSFGTRSLQFPGNYLGKLSRALLEAVSDDGQSLPLAGKLEEMLQALEQQQRYDLILLDVRAGLAEISAGPLLALGAEILIFVTAQVQSLQDLKFLFSHLSRVTESSSGALRERIKMVHAKAAKSERAAWLRNELWELFSEYLYEEASGLDEFNFDADDPNAPHNPLRIPLDVVFADWDPATYPDEILSDVSSRTFGALLSYVEDFVAAERSDGKE